MKKFLFCVAVLGSMLSCSTDNENSATESGIKTGHDVFTFSYKGKSYSSSYDSSKKILNLDNADVNKLYARLQELPELATLENQDGTVTYYDTYADLSEALNLKTASSSKSISGKTAESAGQIFLYENIDRGGRSIPFDVDAFGLNVPDMGAYSFNDRLTSFEMVLNLPNTYIVTIFRDGNYQGRSHSFNGPTSINGVLYIRYLGDYVMTNRFPKDITWNDQMTSFKVSVVYNF